LAEATGRGYHEYAFTRDFAIAAGLGTERPGGALDDNEHTGRPNMIHLDRYRIRVHYQGLEGLSAIGFKLRHLRLDALFPLAEGVLLSTPVYVRRRDGAASLLYEVPDSRFGVAETRGLLDLAVADRLGEYTGLIIDVLACDPAGARRMMDEIEQTCGFVQAKFSDALGIMVMSEDGYLRGLQDSMRLLSQELRH